MKKELIQGESWYLKLLEDIQKLEFTGIILTKWNIGKRLIQDEEKFGKPEYGSHRIENLAKDLNTTTRDLWRCSQFAKKCHAVTQLKDKSWHYIVNNYLPLPKRENDNEILPLPKGKYNIIYADPPWQYYEGGYKNQSQHYDTLTIDKLSTMEVEKLAGENCILFLWATFPMLPEAIELMHQWGFNYSTVGFVWVKANKNKKGFFFGLGNWTRSNAEVCLIGTKGSIERKSASVSQVIYEPIEGHSKKPDIVRDKIIELVGNLPRIELFARQKIKDWDSYGNEI